MLPLSTYTLPLISTRPGSKSGELRIFEYTDPHLRYPTSAFAQRRDATFWKPVHSDTLRAQAKEAGWVLESCEDLTDCYVRWYISLLGKIEAARDVVTRDHGVEAFTFVLEFYTALRDALKEGVLGGGLFRLRATQDLPASS